MFVQFIVSNNHEKFILFEGERNNLKTVDYFNSFKIDKKWFQEKNYDYQISIKRKEQINDILYRNTIE